jgi:hypothetical protein
VLPAVFVVFALVEVHVDVLADVEVRMTRWLGTSLAAFYLAQWAVIGEAFLTSSSGGASVLVISFVCLVATAWSYRKVGHASSPFQLQYHRLNSRPRPNSVRMNGRALGSVSG